MEEETFSYEVSTLLLDIKCGQNKLFNRLIEPNNYTIQLIENEEISSNILNIIVRDYLDENTLTGQNISFLTRIVRESEGKYLEQSNYLEKINNFENFSNIVTYEDKYDSKRYLFVLMISIILFTTNWYFRKKNGLL